MSIQVTPPSKLTICGINDSAVVEVYNISTGTVTGIILRLNLSPGIRYIPGTVKGGGVTESNISNTNQPVFSVSDLSFARNFRFRVMLSADCDLLPFLNSNNTPSVQVRANYTGNYDVGSSIPFQTGVPSVQFGSISNLSFTGDVGTKFGRVITVGNYGKGPLNSITLVRINGRDISTYAVRGGTTKFSGDTVFTVFGPAFFKTIGNKDTFLDQNESFTLTDSNQINGCRYLSTAFELSWGCNGKKCQISRTSGSALISNLLPALKAIPVPVTPTCFNKNIFSSEIRFVNTGKMPAVSPRIAISQNYPRTYSAFDTASVRIKIGANGTWKRVAKDSVTGTYNLGYYGCLGLYPVGLFRIPVPDLNPNDTLFVKWNTESCTVPPCSNASMLLNGWAYYADFKDQCGNRRNVPWTWGKVYNQHYFNTSSFTPTDLINNQTGEFRTLISSASLFPRSGDAQYVVDLILPKGLIHSLQKKDLYFINADLDAYWNPDSIRQKGDTVRGYFPHPVPISLTNAELVYYLKADCSKSGANGMQTVKLQVRYNPDKSCKPAEWLYLTCQSIQLKIHCTVNCNGGMRFRNFSVRRINFGLPDNNNDGVPDTSGSLDTLKLREERCFTGDTLLAEFTGTVKRTSSIITWRNAYIESTVTNGRSLDIAGIQLLVWRRGVVQSVNCSQILSWKTISGNNATFKIDLSTDSMQSCVSSGFRYSTDDSLIVRVKFRVSANIGGAVQTLVFNNRFYTSNVNNPTSNANKFQCDTFSGQMISIGYYFTTCCNDNYQLNSCNQIAVSNNFYLGIGPCCSNYGGNNYFPFEYRSFAKIKAIRFFLPPGFRYKNARFIQYRTAGSNKTRTEIRDSIKVSGSGTNPMEFDVSALYKDSSGGTIQRSDDGFHGNFTAWIEPSCEIQQAGSIPLKYEFVFERLNSLGTGTDTIRSGNADQIIYNKPVVSIQPVSPIIYAAQDTAEWELVYTNYSPTFSNINTWLAADNSGAVKVVQIKDAKADTLLPVTGGIFKAGTVPFNQTRKFRVRAVYNSCNRDSVALYTGWNCQGYPADLASFNCLKDRISLHLEPQNTQYQSTLTDSVQVADLCATIPYVLTIENTGATTGYNTRAFLNLPIGMSVVPGSCYMRYPSGGSKTALPLPTLKNGTLYEWNLASLSSSLAKGLKGVSDITANKIIIYFRVKTDCDYSSGNFLRAGGTGNIKCGDPVQSYTSISNTLNIKGVTRPYYTLVKSESDTIFPCEKPSSVRVSIINLGPAVTGKEDKYQALLLPGMKYDSALYSGSRNAPDNSLTKIRDINGATEVEFSLPDSIQPGDSMVFEYGFLTDSRSVSCGLADIYGQAAVKQEVTCVADNSTCKINVVTGNKLLQVPVNKGNLLFINLTVKLDSMSGDSEYLNVKFTLRNNGSRITRGKPVVVRYLYDQNGSGTADAEDTETGRDTFLVDLNTMSDTLLGRNLSLRAGYSCGMFAVLDSGSCSCGFSIIRLPVPDMKNAGPDMQICSGDTVQPGLPGVKYFRYLWSNGNELSDDTAANPFAYLYNSDTLFIDRQFILTTYRGQCSSKDTVNIRVFRLPSFKVLTADTAVCSGSPVPVITRVSGGSGNWSVIWKPSAGLSDDSSFLPVADGKNSMTYHGLVKDGQGCMASDSVKIIVKPMPDAWFNFDNTCENDSLILIDSSTVSEDMISRIRWTGAGMDTLDAKNIAVFLNATGSDTMRLEVKTPFGCADTVYRAIFVHPLPEPVFTASPVCFGDTMICTQISSISKGSIVMSKWLSGDGNSYTGNAMRHLYQNADTFGVSLVCISDMNCTDTISDRVVVWPVPEAAFSGGGVCLHDTSRMTNLSSITSGSIARYTWITGNDTLNDFEPSYKFQSDSDYMVRLIAESSHGCRDTFDDTARVFSNPAADFTVNVVCEPDSSAVQDLSYVRKGNISEWDYRLSDGSFYTAQHYRHRFTSGDTFLITQIVKTDHGCRDTISKSAIVHPALTPDFSYTGKCISDSFRLSDATGNSGTSVISWKYVVQGDTLSEQNPRLLFSRWGRYPVKLIATSAEACIYDTVKFVTVFPLPEISFYDSNRCVDNHFTFSSQVTSDTGNIIRTSWNFGDGSTSDDPDPEHSFPGAGSFRVVLTSENEYGCIDSLSGQIVSYPRVIVHFETDPVCQGSPTSFRNRSVAPGSSILSDKWYFGDGDSSDQQHPLHIYPAPDTFDVKLTVTTVYNCSYDNFGTAVVFPVPQAGFTNMPDEGTIVDPEIYFTDASTGADSIFYDLGDGNTSVLRNLVNAYPDSGVFRITQIAGNSYSCRDTFSKEIRIRYMFVFNAPTAFTPNNDGINDLYAPGGIGIRNYDMKIFNRWGELIYHTGDGKPWDGTYQGIPVMDGMYAVVFKVRDFKGIAHYYSTSFVLMR